MRVNDIEITDEQVNACLAEMQSGRPFTASLLAQFAESKGVLLPRYGMDENRAPAKPLAQHLISKALESGNLRKVPNSGLRGTCYVWQGRAPGQP